MWYTVLITLVVDVGGLILVYALLRDRVRRATLAEAQIAEIRDEVSRLLVELNQTTDRNVLLIEDRVAGLNELLATADKKIGLLHREIEKHDVGTKIYSRIAEGRSASANAPPGPAAGPVPRSQPQSPQARGPARDVPPEPATTAPPTAAPLAVELSERSATPAGPRRDTGDGAPAAAPEGDVRQRVMMLYRSGFSPSLIAGRVGAPLGEVELIISLEQRKARP